MSTILDKYEQQIENALENNEFVSADTLEDTKQLFQEAAKNYKELQETKSVTLRVRREDLLKIKAKATKQGIAYQTLISLLIHQYISGEREIVL